MENHSGLVRGLTSIGLALSLFQTAAVAEARVCSSNTDRQCWSYVTGTNMGQLAIGSTGNRVGIACAVNASSGTSWGGSIYCYAADGTPGGTYLDAQGGEVAGSSIFSSLVASKRIVSLAIGPDGNPGYANIFVLRGDGGVFTANTQWPIPLPGNIDLNFTQLAISTPSPRAFSEDTSLGLLLTDTSSNQYFVLDTPGGRTWAQLGQPADTVVAGGGAIVDELSVSLWGTTGTTRAVRASDGTMLPNLPHALSGAASDPNSSFNSDAVGIFGPRQYPLATTCTTNYEYAWAVLSGTCGGSNKPCISRSHRTHGTSTWSSWSAYTTDAMYDPTVDPAYPMPTTIQDAFLMRGAFDEIWVIAGYDHLRAWIP